MGLTHQTLGEVLRDVKRFQRPTYAKIVLWMLMEGHSRDDIFYVLWGDHETLEKEIDEY